MPALAAINEFRVNTTTQGNQTNGQIAQDAQGNFVVMWQAQVVFQRYNAAGEPLGGETHINYDVLGFDPGGGASIAMAPDGKFSIVWQHADPDPDLPFGAVYLVQFDADGNIIPNDDPELDLISGQPTTLYHLYHDEPNYYPRQYPKVGMDANGNTLITWWGRFSDTEFAVQGQRLDVNGHELGPSFVIAKTNSTLLKHSLTMANDGSAVVVYEDAFASGHPIRGFALDPNNNVRALSLGASGTLRSVAGTAQGDFAISYLSGLPAIGRIQRFDRWGEPIGAAITGVPNGPIAVDSVGNVTLALFNNGVRVSRFNAQNVLREPTFLASTTAAGLPTAALMQPDGSFVVVWNGQDSNGSGVFAKQFTDNYVMSGGSVAGDADPSIVEDETVLSQINELRVQFSRGPSAIGGSLGLNSATNPANWELLEDGIDVTTSIDSITVESGTIVLKFDKPLRGESYQLTVRDAIHDTLGRALDGDSDGQPGGNFIRNFGVHQGIFGVGRAFAVNDISTAQANVLFNVPFLRPNGGFDIGWGAWTPTYRDVIRRFDETNAPLGPAFAAAGLGLTNFFEDPWGNIVSGSYYNLPSIARLDKLSSTGQLLGSKILFQSPDPGVPLPSVAMNPDGSFVAAWNDSDSVYAQRFGVDFQPIGEVIPVGLVGWGPDYQILPGGVATNASGEFVVAWHSLSGAGAFVRKFAADGAPLTSIVTVREFAYNTHVAIDDNGQFVVVYRNGNSVYSQKYDSSGAAIGTEQPLSNPANPAELPRIAMAADGRAIVVWRQTGGQASFMAVELDSAGEKVGDPFVIAAATTSGGATNYPNVAANAAGDIIVTWRGSTVGSQVSIYAQRLSFDRGAVVDLNGPGAGVDYAASFIDDQPASLVDADWMYVSDAAVNNLWSATLTIEGYELGDIVTVDTTGTGIVVGFEDGVLTLTGLDTVAHYEQVMRTATFASSVGRPLGSEVIVTFVVNDGYYDSAAAETTITYALPVPSSVVGRYLFYNESMFDGNNASIQPIAAGAFNDDSDAIDPSKSAYVPGSGLATFANITSYHKGINGITIDLSAGGDHGSITLADFVFKVGNNNSPSTWTAAGAASAISMTAGGGVSGSDRVTITWASGSIVNTWLQVQVLATAQTGLGAPDVFFWGNKIGDSGTGTPATAFHTTTTDAAQVFATLGSGKPITDLRDYSRDGSVTTTDAALVFAHLGSIVRLDLPGEVVPFSSVAPGDAGIPSALAGIGRGQLLPSAAVPAWRPARVVVEPLAQPTLHAAHRAWYAGGTDDSDEPIYSAEESFSVEISDRLVDDVLSR